jgi:hypothetical protein
MIDAAGATAFETPVAFGCGAFMRRLLARLDHLSAGILGGAITGANLTPLPPFVRSEGGAA